MKSDLPDGNPLFRCNIHLIAFLNIKSFIESFDVLKWNDGPVHSRRVWIGLDKVLQGLISHLGSPHGSPGHEESLLRSEAVYLSRMSVLFQVKLQTIEGCVHSSKVSNVLPKGEFSVDEYAVENFNGTVLVRQ